MPIYSIRNNNSGEFEEDVMMSWNSLQEYLKDNPHLESVITKAPALATSGNTGALTKAGDGWKEVQDKIKSGLPPRLRDNIKTK
jgi:hypothetical protein